MKRLGLAIAKLYLGIFIAFCNAILYLFDAVTKSDNKTITKQNVSRLTRDLETPPLTTGGHLKRTDNECGESISLGTNLLFQRFRDKHQDDTILPTGKFMSFENYFYHHNTATSNHNPSLLLDIERAIEIHENNEVVKDQHISETGKRLSKLPVQNRLWPIIAKGEECGVLYESVVLSVLCSVGSSLYYRGFSQTERKKFELKKLQFCHHGGDSLSLMNVFREWNKQPKNEKYEWCIQNSINTRVIRSIKEMVNKICALLKYELGLDVTHSFKKSSHTDKILQTILFECFSVDLCYFLGHTRAGYYAVNFDHLVYIHPSSVLNSLGLVPQWIVFEQALKTSRDFVMCLTPVDDSSVQRAVARGILCFDTEILKKKQVHLIHTEYVGSRVFWCIVGPNFSNLKNLQDKEILEADKEKGEIKIFGTRDDSSCLIELLKPIICLVQNDLQYEDYERPLSQQFESVNVVIGSGGEVTQVLMPDEYRSVFIEKAGKNTNEATVRQKLCQFGVIKECKIFKDSKSNRWGRVTFETSDQAKQAVAATKDDKCMVAVAEKRVLMQESTTEFKAKITWCRRISKDHAYVDLASEQLPILLSHSPILIDKCQVRVQLHRMSESTCTVCLNELSAETQERDITAAVLQALGPHTDSHVIHKVIVVREKVNTTPEMLNLFRSRIEEAIKKYATSGQFSVKVITPRPHSTMYVAYAHFHHLDECQKACSMLSQNFTMSTRKLLMEPNIVTQVFVKGNIFKVIEQDLRNSVEYLNHLEGTTSLRLNELRSGNYVIYINSSDAVQTARARSFLLAIIQGEVLDCKDNSSLKHLFTKSGKQFLAGLQSKLACLIVVDDRTMTVSIKGNSEVCTDVSLSISEYLGSISVDEWKDIYLRGPQKPAGVMKVLTAKYGSDLEMLKNEMELVSVNLDHHRHKVEVAGSSEAIKKTEATIEKMIAELASTLPLKTPADGRPKCVVCLQPVEYDQLYRLESCGHPYCNECIEQQLQVALDCKDFPIGCAQERCYMHFMWRDLSNFIKNGSVSLEQLVVSSVSAFVSRNHKDYRYCITPDCPVIYRVSAEGSMFKCCECQIRICTSCHIQFHDGLTCTMYKSQEEGGSTLLKQWMQLNENSKHCPCCQTPIEKTQGCDTMVCSACKKIFCWLCKQVFASKKQCSAHRAKHHDNNT